MKIGVLIRYSKADVDFLVEQGFRSCELLIWSGDPLDPNVKGNDRKLEAAREYLAEKKIEVSAVGAYPNLLDPDPAKARRNQAHLKSLIPVCKKLGVKTLCTFAGRIPDKSIGDNIPAFKKVFTPIVKRIENSGLKLAFENCPMFHSFPHRGVNIAYTPVAWDAMFEAIPSEAIGLEYDPSHLICQLIDPVQTIREYGSRIFHVHAKDAEVLWHKVRRIGFFERGAVRDRTPGLGQVNWKEVVSALVEAGYRGNMDIEGRHDPVYSRELEHAGLIIARRHLEQFVIQD
ncbi:MAG: sugar phosphate isomerase/epimerase [Phycisphaerae bacterium]|nr:sugar phosphate isomerase/epimerase [Phycisphaerae bacterium]